VPDPPEAEIFVDVASLSPFKNGTWILNNRNFTIIKAKKN
jgi:hypothetical protein